MSLVLSPHTSVLISVTSRPVFDGDCIFFQNSDILNLEKIERGHEIQKTKTFTAEIKARGQLTIPKIIRVMDHLEEGQIVSIIPVGNSAVIVSKRCELDDARREIKRILRETGTSLDDLLIDLKEEREKLYQEAHGKKTS